MIATRNNWKETYNPSKIRLSISSHIFWNIGRMISWYLTFCQTLRKKYPDSELFWSAFPRIWTKYGQILRISESPYFHFTQCNVCFLNRFGLCIILLILNYLKWSRMLCSNCHGVTWLWRHGKSFSFFKTKLLLHWNDNSILINF